MKWTAKRYEYEWVMNAIARDPYARAADLPSGIACEWVFDDEGAARAELARKEAHPLAQTYRYELYRRAYVAAA